MSWENILKNKVPTFEETGAFDDNKKEWTLYLEYYTKGGYPAETYDEEHKFTGTEEEAIEFAIKTKEPWEDDLMDYGVDRSIMRGSGTWTLVWEYENGRLFIEENGEREYEEK